MASDQGRARRLLFPTAAAIVLATLSMLGAHGALNSNLVDLNIQVAELLVRMPNTAGSRSEQPFRPDFTRRLPPAPMADSLLEEFRRAAADAGVALSSVSTGFREPTEQALGRLQIAIVLRGSYPTVKAALAQVAARFPNLVFQRVSVRRLATPTDVEARVDVMLPVAPERRASDSPPSN